MYACKQELHNALSCIQAGLGWTGKRIVEKNIYIFIQYYINTFT